MIIILKDRLISEVETDNIIMIAVNPIRLIVQIFQLMKLVCKIHRMSKVRAENVMSILGKHVKAILEKADSI